MDSNLKASLQHLHDNLSAGAPVDEELQALLLQLDGDIQALLARRSLEEQAVLAEPTEPTEPTEPADSIAESTTYGLAERTQELSAKFAVKHPQLEPALRELGTILSNMGI